MCKVLQNQQEDGSVHQCSVFIFALWFLQMHGLLQEDFGFRGGGMAGLQAFGFSFLGLALIKFNFVIVDGIGYILPC